jgi:transposase
VLGGNIDLRALVDRDGDSRVRDNLVFSLLEYWPMRTWDEVEAGWDSRRPRMRGFCPRARRRFVVMSRPRKYPVELLGRGARVVIESGRPIAHVARDLGIPSETLRKYVRRLEADEGLRPDLPTAAEREEIKQLRKENYELRRANEILKAASVFFATELDPDRTK